MPDATAVSANIHEARRDALVERIFTATLSALELLHVYLGDRLGLCQALADRGSAMSVSDPVALASKLRGPVHRARLLAFLSAVP